MSQTIRFTKMPNRSQQGYVTWGAPWKKGSVKDTASYALTDETGNKIPIQSSISAYWPDGSIKWSRHTAKLPKNISAVVLTAETGIEEKTTFVREEKENFFVEGSHVHDVSQCADCRK